MSKQLISRCLGGALLFAAGAAQPAALAQGQGTAGESTAASHLFVKRGAAEKLEPSPTTVSRVMLTADQTNGRYSVIDEIFQPGLKTPSHKHAYHSETFIVVTGRMRWTIGGDTETIGPGDLVYIPPDTSHSTEVLGDEAAHVIMLYEPGGYEIGLRQRAAARRAAAADSPGARPRRAPNPYADFIPDAPPGQ